LETISRRKLLASIGIAGAALATGDLVNVGTQVADGKTDVTDSVYGSSRDKIESFESIAALTAYTRHKDKQVALVMSYYAGSNIGGGLFYADASDTTTVSNGGTVIVAADGTRWKRIYSTTLQLEDFGYKDSNTAAENTTVLTNALAASSNITLRLPANKTIQVAALNATGSFVTLVGSNTTIQFTQDVNNTPIVLTSSTIDGITFDGQNFSIGVNHGTYGVMGFAVLVGAGAYFGANNCTFKNLYGLENNYQYGLTAVASAKTYIRNCTFSNIRTRTNTANTAGFCGGYFMFQPTGITMTASQHLIENCRFEDIYTMQNAAAQLYHDSDAIRCYFNQYGKSVAGYDDAVQATVIKVQNCTFINVLKSSCKLQHAKVVIDSCYSEVNSLKDQGQTWVYTGFRYQYGENVTITNCEVVGYYRFGCYVAGTNNVVDNLTTSLLVVSGVEQAAVQVGELSAGNVDYCELANINSSYGIYALGANRLIVRDSKLGKPILANVTSCKFVDCELTNLMDNSSLRGYNPSIGKIEYIGCKVTYAAGVTLMLTLSSTTNIELYMRDCKIVGSASLLPTTTYPYALVDIRNCEFTLTDNTTSTTRRFMMVPSTVTVFTVIDVVINDSRTSTPDLVIATNSNSTVTKISGVTLNGNSANLYTRLMYLTSVAINSVVENCLLKNFPSGVDAVTTTNSNLAIRNIGCLYPSAKFVINQTSGTGYYPFIGNYGNLATPHIVSSGAGTVTVLEYGTAKYS